MNKFYYVYLIEFIILIGFKANLLQHIIIQDKKNQGFMATSGWTKWVQIGKSKGVLAHQRGAKKAVMNPFWFTWKSTTYNWY